MLKLVFAALCLGLGVSSSLETDFWRDSYSGHANLSCTSYETDCGTGCCPFSEAVCCIDGIWCCPHDKTCIPFIGMCLGLETKENKDPLLVSSKATPIKNLTTSCPSGTTECSPGKCCIFPNAVCCEDQEHCCPQGYSCDMTYGKCVKKISSNEVDSHEIPFVAMNIMPQEKTFNKPTHKSCPGGYRQCPNYASCCLNDEGTWSCCPNPALYHRYKAGSGECCNTIFGYMCCPDDYPTCTIFGCTK